MEKQKVKIRIPESIYNKVVEDLNRPHPFAFERVGFIFSKQVIVGDFTLVICVDYMPVNDEDYIDDDSAGAVINSDAIAKALAVVYNNNYGCFHVHLHGGMGYPRPSGTDLSSLPEVAESFYNVEPELVHGFLIFNEDHVYVNIESDFTKMKTVESVSVNGFPLKLTFLDRNKKVEIEMYDRQSFLGKESQFIFENVRVGIIGYGGGGSHIGQQLAHIGIKNFIIFDDDKVENTNLNRLVGAHYSDINASSLKTVVAERLIKAVSPSANVISIIDKWQNRTDQLQICDIIIGAIDSYTEREQLEAESRRYVIPYIDIGMDVHKIESTKSFYMSGQVILSIAEKPCMKCMGYITHADLAKEYGKYGNAGNRPQVVWANGVLASSAVGILIELLTGWTKVKNRTVYLSYDGNKGTLTNHPVLDYIPNSCEHYEIKDVGLPNFKML